MTADGLVSTDSLPFSMLKRIDTICDQFEVDRQEGRWTEVAEYRARLERATGTQARQELLCQLIVLDLEYRWRCDDVEAQSNTKGPSTLDDYQTELPELVDLPAQQFLDLIAAEYRARHVWGDCPRQKEYLERFPELATDLNSRLHAVMAQLMPTKVKVYHDGELVYSTILSSPLEIGRQRPGEPDPCCRVEGDDRDRLVIAPLDEKRVSRCHLRVELGSKGKVRVVNRSGKIAVIVNSDDRLAPGETCFVERASLIFVGNRVIRLEAY